jgi:hypothetical protein
MKGLDHVWTQSCNTPHELTLMFCQLPILSNHYKREQLQVQLDLLLFKM